MSIALFVIAGWISIGALAAINAVGKERKPLEPSTAVRVVVIGAFMVIVLVLAALQLLAVSR